MPECPETPAEISDQLSETDLNIRALNDEFRRTFTGGEVYLTIGFRSLPQETVARALSAIREFGSFDEGLDPYQVHEFGCVEVDGNRIWFRIEAFDLNLEYASPDPCDPNVTRRVMTVYLPEEH